MLLQLKNASLKPKHLKDLAVGKCIVMIHWDWFLPRELC